MAKTSRKDEIAKAATVLFNKRGYDNVSLREIADAAGTTIGNLTYHFPQKEDLIVFIQAGVQTDYLENSCPEAEDGPSTLAAMLTLLEEGQKNLERNPFYFQNLVELSKDNKSILQGAQSFRGKLYHQYLHLLHQLVRCGLMRSDITQAQYETAAVTLIMNSSFWVQNTSPYYDEALPKIDLYQAQVNMIYPYLTQAGVVLMQKKIGQSKARLCTSQ